MRSAEHKFLRLGVRDSTGAHRAASRRGARSCSSSAPIILGSIESSFFTGDQLRMLAEFVSQRGGTLLALGGRGSLAEGGYTGTPVAEVLPVLLNAAKRRHRRARRSSSRCIRPSAGRTHAALQLRDGDGGERGALGFAADADVGEPSRRDCAPGATTLLVRSPERRWRRRRAAGARLPAVRARDGCRARRAGHLALADAREHAARGRDARDASGGR